LEEDQLLALQLVAELPDGADNMAETGGGMEQWVQDMAWGIAAGDEDIMDHGQTTGDKELAVGVKDLAVGDKEWVVGDTELAVGVKD